MTSVLFDYDRPQRIGLPEAVFCQGKSVDVVQSLLERFHRGSGTPVLFTRLQPDVFASMPEAIRNGIDYHALSRTAFGETLPPRDRGSVAVVSAGTADGSVVWEAARTLEYLGIRHTVYEDCGVAGLWRLLERIDAINAHDVILVVAGMDAALASVMGGLTAKPLIAVPTSTGYGASEQGFTALKAMLASCASGVTVMNIDNGYGAACAAVRIVNLFHVDR